MHRPRRHALILAFTVIGATCSEATAPGAPDDLVTRITITPAVLRPSDTALVTVIVHNPTRHLVTFLTSCASTVFRVYRAGARVDERFCAIPESHLVKVGAGDSLVSTYRWSTVGYWGAGVRDTLPAGTYALIGGVDVLGDFRAQSAPVLITVHRPS